MQPFSAEIIGQRLDEILDAVLSSRRTTAEPATALAEFSREQQEFTLSWLSVITKTNSELGYQFIRHVPQALTQMDPATIEKWIIHAMDVYDRLGLYPASEAFAELEGFARDTEREMVSVTLNEKATILDRYFRGLSGRTLRIEEKPAATDQRRLRAEHLPFAGLTAQLRHGLPKVTRSPRSPFGQGSAVRIHRHASIDHHGAARIVPVVLHPATGLTRLREAHVLDPAERDDAEPVVWEEDVDVVDPYVAALLQRLDDDVLPVSR